MDHWRTPLIILYSLFELILSNRLVCRSLVGGSCGDRFRSLLELKFASLKPRWSCRSFKLMTMRGEYRGFCLLKGMKALIHYFSCGRIRTVWVYTEIFLYLRTRNAWWGRDFRGSWKSKESAVLRTHVLWSDRRLRHLVYYTMLYLFLCIKLSDLYYSSHRPDLFVD